MMTLQLYILSYHQYQKIQIALSYYYIRNTIYNYQKHMKTKLLFALVVLTMLFTLQKAHSQPNLLTPAPIDDTAPGSGGSGYAGVNGAYSATNPYYPLQMSVVLWSGDNATGNKVWVIPTNWSFSSMLTDDFTNGDHTLDGRSANDEARSLIITGAPAGKVIELYDSPSSDTSDDWCQITVKQNIAPTSMYVLFGFEGTYEDAYVKVVYHHYNGLNGKVSSYKVY